MNFTLETPKIIYFGPGVRKKLPEVIPGKKILLIIGSNWLKKSKWFDEICSLFKDSLKDYIVYQCPKGEPTIESIQEAIDKTGDFLPDLIVGIGGGSVLDTAKSLSGTINKETEGIGKGIKITSPCIPWIALPTTSGTGTEATKNAVIKADQKGYKKSIRSSLLYAHAALVDPELTLELPLYQTCISGLDALSQLIESYLSKKANILTDSLVLNAIPLMLEALKKMAHSPKDMEARSQAAYGALISGIALSNSGLGAIHGFASALGGMYNIPHGLICGCFLPVILERNAEVSGKKLKVLGRLFNKDVEKNPVEYLKKEISSIFSLYRIESNLKKYDIPSRVVPEIARRSSTSSMSGNPVELSMEEREKLLRRII
jgi:alcohol dehydrogenase class IV